MTLQALSYTLAALAYLWIAWRLPAKLPARRRQKIRAALIACSAWALVLAVFGSGWEAAIPWAGLVVPAEVVFFGALLLALGALDDAPIAYWLRRLNLVIWLIALVTGIAIVIEPSLTRLGIFIGLVLCLLCLANAEQVFRNSAPAAAQAIKFCIVGLGGQIAYDLFLYSQAQLLGAFDPMAWALRGLVFAGLVPLFGIGLRRMAEEKPALFVSRQVVFYTTALLSVGIYLIVMAVGGYYVRVRGGSWGENLRLLFFVGAGVVLALLVLSPTLWRRLRVFVAKHFFRNKYDYRIEWLRFIDTLSTPELTDVRITSIRAIAQILESPGGLLFLRDEGDESFKQAAFWSQNNEAETQLPPFHPADDLPRFLVEKQWVIDLDEYRRQPSLYRSIKLPDWLNLQSERWRIVSPLFQHERLIGVLCFKAPPDPFQMTFEDRDLLRTAGRHVATLLAQQSADRKLADGRQFETFNRFAAFVMHDLKNSAAQLQLIVANAARHRENPRFMDDAIDTIGNTAARMTRLIEQLRSPDGALATSPVFIAPLLANLAHRCEARPPGLKMSMGDLAHGLAVQADQERLTAVLEHIVRNAQEAAGGQGEVLVDVGADERYVLIVVRDNGPGMDPAFIRDRLFRPFDSTKGAKGMGIGAYQARDYVGQLGGSVEVQSSPGSGTTFLIKLPLCRIPSPAS